MTAPVLSAAAAVMGKQITVDLTGAASAAFTHDLSYTLPDGSGKVFAEKKGAEKVTLTVPDFAQMLPAAETGVLTVACTTYDGSGALLGTKTATMTASVPPEVLPVITKVTVTETAAGLAQKYGGFIQSKSRPKVEITAAGAKGSTVASITAALDGRSYSGASWTASALAGSGTLPLRVTVKDSRGRTASHESSIAVMAYAVPAITAFGAVRCTQNGTAADNGDYVKLQYAYNVPSLNGGNTAAMTIQAKRSTASAYDQTLLTGSALSANTSAVGGKAVSGDYRWDIRMTVQDSFGAATTATVQLPSADVVMDFKADGTGIGVGKTSEQAGLDINWPVTMRKSLKALAGVEGALTGNASTATTADKVKNPLSFTGGVTGSWNGSSARSIYIPAGWTKLWENAAPYAAMSGNTYIDTSTFRNYNLFMIVHQTTWPKDEYHHHVMTNTFYVPWDNASYFSADYLRGVLFFPATADGSSTGQYGQRDVLFYSRGMAHAAAFSDANWASSSNIHKDNLSCIPWLVLGTNINI